MHFGPDLPVDVLATYSNLLQNTVEFAVIARAFFPVELRSQRARIRTTFLRRVVERCRDAGVDLNQSNLQEISGAIGVEPVDGDELAPGDGAGASRSRGEERHPER